MDDQFSDLSIPDPNEYFHCSPMIQSKGFTHLMKLVLMANNINAIILIKEIITNNPEEIDKQNEKGWSALMIASRNSATRSSVEVVRILLEAESNPNLQDIYGWSALMRASINSNHDTNVETVKLLLEAGCDPNLRNNDSCTALILASRDLNHNSNIETVKLLLEAGSDPNLQCKHGATALMWASVNSECSKIETVKLLLEAGSDPNLQDKYGRTALHCFLKWCNLEKNMECIEQLILASQKSIPIDGSFYDIYLEGNVNILDDYYIRILKGEMVVNKTKSARN